MTTQEHIAKLDRQLRAMEAQAERVQRMNDWAMAIIQNKRADVQTAGAGHSTAPILITPPRQPAPMS